METKTFVLKDGRNLAYEEFGNPKGVPVFHAHGGPGSRLEGEWFHDMAIKEGFRVIATDRPGFGESSYKPDRKHGDYARDIAELADSLHIDKFGVMGWSGGGMPTTICAHVIPDRLLFSFSFSGYTNWGQMPDAPSYLAGGRDDFENASTLYKLSDIKGFESSLKAMEDRLKADPEEAYALIISQLNETDKAIAGKPPFKKLFIQSQLEAFKQGSLGPGHDGWLHCQDWGFRLEDIAFPIHVFHGTADGLVPIEYAKHLRDKVPDCTLTIWDGEGHFAAQDHMEEIFGLAGRAIS